MRRFLESLGKSSSTSLETWSGCLRSVLRSSTNLSSTLYRKRGVERRDAKLCVPSDPSVVTLRIVRDDPRSDSDAAYVDEVALTPASSFAPPVSLSLPVATDASKPGTCAAAERYPTGAWVVARDPDSMDLLGGKPLITGQHGPEL